MRLRQLAPWLLCIAIALIYLLFPTRVYYWDGITFAQTIEDVTSLKPSLVHPNHLIYNFVGYIFYKLLRSLGAGIRALTALQILNCLLSAVCARIFFAILFDTLRSFYLSVCLTLLFAFSATWWKFSTDADAYIPSVLFVLVSFYLVLPTQKARPLLLAVTFFISMAFHQLAVLMWPVLALGLYLQNGELSIKRRALRTAFFSVVAAVLIIASYAYLYYLASGSSDPHRLLSWTASYSPDADTGFNLWSNLRYSLRGHVRLFFGGRFSLLKGLMNPFLVVMIAAVAGTVVFVLLSWLRSLQTAVRVRRLPELRLETQQKTVLRLALLWTFLYVVFLFFWLPQNTFYRLFYMPALILLLGLLLVGAQGRAAKPRTLAAFVLAVALANFVFMIYPFSLEGAPNSGFTTSLPHITPRHQTEYSYVSGSNSPHQADALTHHSTPAR